MRDREPVELIHIALPVLIEAVVVTLFIGAGFVWLILLATPAVPA